MTKPLLQDVLEGMEFCFNLIQMFEKVMVEASEKLDFVDNSFEPQLRIADQARTAIKQANLLASRSAEYGARFCADLVAARYQYGSTPLH